MPPQHPAVNPDSSVDPSTSRANLAAVIQISMSRRGNPYDNATAESFIKTLKYEEVYLNDYETLAEARTSIDHFLEEVYNQKRLHSALGYAPPIEFEQIQSPPESVVSPRDLT